MESCIVRRDLAEPRLSPDGSSVSFVSRSGGAAAIVVVPADGGPERQVTSLPPPVVPRGTSGGCHEWLPDGTGIVYSAADGNLWCQPFPGGGPRRLTRVADGSAASTPSVSPDGTSVAYVVDAAEVHLVDLGSGRTVRVDDGADDFVGDPFVALVADGATEIRWQAWNVPDMPWDGAFVRIVEVRTGRTESRIERRIESRIEGHAVRRSPGAIQQPRRTPDGRVTEVRDDTGWLNVWIDGAPVVAEPFEHAGPTWGPGQRSYAWSPDGRRVAFTRNERGFGRLCVAELGSGTVRELGRGVHGQLDWRGDRLVALRSGARTPTEIAVYTVAAAPPDAAEPVTPTRRRVAVGPLLVWDHVDLPEPDLVEVAHDGQTVHARRYAAGHGRMLCWVHGGPTDQWQVEFLPRVAYWWSRGWDVLAVDPRGSTGHGRAYQQALRGGWGRMDVDDTAALVRHAHACGWARPSTTVAIGGSSGGLTVLGLLADHADLVAGGITLYPVADLLDLADRSHRFEAHYTLTLVGPLADVARYRSRSPRWYADRIGGPLLVMHGDADPVVPVEQSIELAAAVRAAGGSVDLHVFEGEGHGFRSPEHQRAEYDLIAAFLDRVLGTGGLGVEPPSTAPERH